MAIMSAAGLTALAPPTFWLPVTVVVTIGLVVASLLPFTLRFGMSGVLVFLVSAQLAGIVALLVAAMFGGLGGPGTTVRSAVKAVVRMRDALGPAGFSAAAIAAVLLLNLASYRLSARIYRRREF